MVRKNIHRILAVTLVCVLMMSLSVSAFACSGMELTSKEGDAYWFRTCDMNDMYNVFGEKGSYIACSSLMSYPADVPIAFYTGEIAPKYSIIGTSFSNSYALLDGMNSAGLCGGLLMFDEGTSYPEDEAPEGYKMFASMEGVTWILSQCADVKEVKELMETTVVKAIELPGIPGSGLSATMHLMFTDKTGASIVLENSDPEHPGEYTIYEDCNGVMTNSPLYSTHLEDYKAYIDAGEDGVIPSGDDSSSRFVRLSAQRDSIDGGKTIAGSEMLTVGSMQMARVTRPLVTSDPFVEGSYTMYTVAYDIADGTMYMRPYDTVVWTSLSFDNIPSDAQGAFEIFRGESTGILTAELNDPAEEVQTAA